MKKTIELALLILLAVPFCRAQNIHIKGVSSASGNISSVASIPPSAAPFFSQTGSLLTIFGCAGGQSVLYKTDGTLVSLAANLYSAPITVTPGETISAICATVGAYQTNTQATGTGWVCHVGPNQSGSITFPSGRTCSYSGGVGSITPTNLVQSFGSPATFTITAPASSGGESQALFVNLYGGSADPTAPICNTCTTIVKDIKFTVIGAGMANQEHDSPWYNNLYGTDAQNGTQCQGYGTGARIAVDSGNAGGWTLTSIPCSTWTAGTTHEEVNSVTVQWTNTACTGAHGCAHYNYYWMDGTKYTMNGTYSNSQGYHTQSGETPYGWQFQPDLAATGGSPVTAGWSVISSTVALGKGDESLPQSYTVAPVSGVATPVFSVASGAVAPGTTTTPSTSTSGAVVAYTIDGTTPGCQTYAAGAGSPILGTGTSMIYRSTVNSHGSPVTVPDPAIYGPMTFKAIGCKNGLTPSAVATYAYTLTAPTGTGISAGTTTLTGTNYLTSDVTCTGTCFGVTAANTVLNLNGHTVTYGTASGIQSSGTGLVTNGTTTGTCSGCAFTSAINGLKIFADNYNTGGYQNTGDTTTVTYVSSTQITFSSAPAFSTSNAEWFIANPPVYGVACDPSVYGTCTALKVYNGTITQGNVLDAPQSNVIEVNPHAFGGANGPFVFANITANYSAPEALFLYENDSSGADLLENLTLNDSVTQIFYRDGLQYPIKFNNGTSTPTTPVKMVFDNQILNSPQGGIQCSWQCYGWNNYINNTTSNQYANGYGIFAGNGSSGQGASGSSFTGNTVLGATRGGEIEESAITMQFNQINVEDSATVHDPNHNPVGCEIDGGYGIRTKDFSSGLNNITSSLIDSNLVTVTTGPCGGQVIRYTAIGASDAGTNSNNNYNIVANTTNGPSSFDSIDGAVMSGFTYANETYNSSGADVSSLYNNYVWFDQGTLWTVPNLVSPKVIWYQGNSGANSSATLTGTGTATCHKVPNGSSTSTMNLTYNGTSVPCT